jgi:hypothetical protein
MSNRGGRRPGAGRPKGKQSKTTIKAKATISELAQKHAPDALKALVEIATKGESESARVSAANALLDRGYGKPSQAHQHSGPNGGPIPTIDLTNATEQQLDALEALFGPIAGGPGVDDAGSPG